MDSQPDIAKLISSYGNRIDALMRKVLTRRGQGLLIRPIRHHFGTGGKRIRPAICLITCEALGGNPDRALHFALAIEILHNMFLIHDDLEDGDRVRRNKPTVWVKFGIPNAVNVGDYLLAKVFDVATMADLPDKVKLKLIGVLTRTCMRTIEGQAMDINSRGDANFTVRKYLKMVRLKTGCYLACGMVGGAIIAGAPESVQEKLWRLGDVMGPAFQIRDDLIDLTTGKGRGGEIGCDIREGKPSILYAYALRHANESETLRRIMLKPREKTTNADVQRVIRIYRECGAVEKAERKAEELLKKSVAIIRTLPLKNKPLFMALADYMISRRK